METLYKIERILFKIELSLIVILLLFLSVFAFSQVILRNVFSSSIIWMAVYNNMALLMLAMLGASIATSSFERSHINIDLFQGILKFPYNRYLSASLSLVAAGACLICFLFAADYVLVSKAVGKVEHAIHTPEWVLAMIFPLCFLSMSFKFFVCFLRDLSEIRSCTAQD